MGPSSYRRYAKYVKIAQLSDDFKEKRRTLINQMICPECGNTLRHVTIGEDDCGEITELQCSECIWDEDSENNLSEINAAWDITIKALKQYLNKNSECDNINDTIDKWVMETIDAIRETNQNIETKTMFERIINE